MMYQARHYRSIAALLAQLRSDALDHGDMFLLSTVETFASRLCDTFACDNARFNRDRFLAAIGLDSSTLAV